MNEHTNKRERRTEQVLTIIKNRVLDVQDSIYSYRTIIDNIRHELKMDTPEFKLQFGIDHELPYGYLSKRHEYLWLLNVRREYVEYLHDILKKQGRHAIGIPIFIDDPITNDDQDSTSFRLKHVYTGNKKLKRQYFFDKPEKRGTEVVYLHENTIKGTKSGYQFWIVMWNIVKNNLSLTISTWIIDHDTNRKRNTLYLARSYTFTEVPDYDPAYDPEFKRVPRLIKYSPSLTAISERIRALAFTTAKEVTHFSSPSDDGWVLTAAPYGVTESMHRIRYMLEQFDMSGIIETMKDKFFKQQWFRLLAKLFWYDNDVDAYLKSPDRIAESGLLRHDWFQPITTHPRDKEQYDKNKEGFIKVREAYNKWSNRFWKALNGMDVDLSDEIDFPEYPLHERSPDDNQ